MASMQQKNRVTGAPAQPAAGKGLFGGGGREGVAERILQILLGQLQLLQQRVAK